MFIHKDKNRFRFNRVRVARCAEEAAEMLAGDMASPIMDMYACPICKTEIVGTRMILTHMQEKHPKNAQAIFSLNPNAYKEWVIDG